MLNSFVRESVHLSKYSTVSDMIRYYVLFANYEQGMYLHDLLNERDIRHRIAPAPRSIQGELSCGMSLMVEPVDLDMVKQCIEETGAACHDIVPMESQLKSHRDQYC